MALGLRHGLIAGLLVCAGIINTVQAQTAGPTLDDLAHNGLRVKQLNTQAGCLVDMAVDSDQFLISIGRLQDAGLLGNEWTLQGAQTHLATAVLAFGLRAAGYTAHLFITQSGQPSCHFREALLAGGQTYPMFEFDFDRATDSRFDWSMVSHGMGAQEANAFAQMAPNFRRVPAFVQRVQAESGQ